MTEVTIKKREWVRKSKGCNRGPSVLRQHPDQCAGHTVRQCCLGFIARACGFTPSEIEGLGTLWSLNQNLPERAKALGGLNPALETGMILQSEMVRVNDDVGTTDREKIAALKALGRVAGFRLVFVP